MKLLLHPTASALGLSLLCCLPLIGPLISPAHSIVYHSSGPVESIFVAALLDVIILWLILTGLFLIAQKLPKLWLGVWLALVVLGPWTLLKIGAKVQAWLLPHLVSRTLFFGSAPVPARYCDVLATIFRAHIPPDTEFCSNTIRVHHNLRRYHYQPASLVSLASARIENTYFIASSTR